MTKEEKKLLLKDLCARLPYGVKCYAYQSKIDGNDCECYGTFEGILYERFYLSDRVSVNGDFTYDNYYIEVKPYLRPMSSITEEEIHKLSRLINGRIELDCGTICSKARGFAEGHEYLDTEDIITIIDWLNANHFDYSGLIKKGLALPAPDGMYNFK